MTPSRALKIAALATALATALVGCGEPDPGGGSEPPPGSGSPDPAQRWAWELPEGVPPPTVPEDNPMTRAKVELGRHLFYDERLSANQTQSCASCHLQQKAFTDGRATALGSTGQAHFRNSMSLTNAAYNSTLGWAGPATPTLERQMPIPMFGEEPVELGLSVMSEGELLARFEDDEGYQALFARAFPEAQDPITLDHLIDAIASFERAMLSFGSPFDRYTYGGDAEAMSDSALRGMQLFFSERLECFHCHGGFNFSDAIDHDGLAFQEEPFHNTGLYNVGGQGAYPDKDRGLYDITGEPEDMGRFKAPTLRNIAVTAPYFHDGSAATLEEVIAHYERGGRAVVSGPYIGDGSQNPHKSELIIGFVLEDQEREDLVAFLESLTDESFLNDPALSDPEAQ